MNVVYILGNGSTWENNELRYSLRSLKYLEGFNSESKVFIIGVRPIFLKNIIHVPAKDNYPNKNQNAIKKILIACEQEEIENDFLLMNDDFLFMKPQAYKLYGRDSLKLSYEKFKKRYGGSKYINCIKNSISYLETKGILEPKDFEIHYPIVYNKNKFKEIFSDLNWKKTPYLHRSIYGNMLNLTHELTVDFKIFDLNNFNKMKFNKFISSDNHLTNLRVFRLFCKESFPFISKFEKF
jgi:hypothetical protein